jgi:SAM-dependent methyltransferase
MTSPNKEQAEHWNSAEETGRWVTHQEQFDRMLAPFADLVLGAAELTAGQQVLDVGCGCGTTTLAAARAVAPGMALGVDLSGPMVARATASAERAGVGNVAFRRGDAQVQPLGAGFDAVISRFGVMFFEDPVAAFANIRSATRPGARLTFACWQPLTANDWLALPVAALAERLPLPDLGEPGAPGMFSLDQPDRIRSVLTAAGWRDIDVTAAQARILVGGGELEDAVNFVREGSVGRRVLAGGDGAARARAIAAARDLLASHRDEQGVRLPAAVWLVQARS